MRSRDSSGFWRNDENVADWTNKVIVISGGSAGLGLQIGRAFGRRGATTILWARDRDRLEAARQQLSDEGISVEVDVVDASDDASVEAGVQSLLAKHGQLDGLINVVGRSTRQSSLETTLDDYREFLDTNFETAVRCSLAALPHLLATNGHLVNIGSLAAKTAWSFMGPYTASKYALAGFTQQLRLEAYDRLHVMLVCPGPIQREDSGQRYNDDASQLPEEARKPGGGAPVKGLDPEWLANCIVKGCEKRQAEIVAPGWLKLLFLTSQWSAALGDWVLRKAGPKRKDDSSQK